METVEEELEEARSLDALEAFLALPPMVARVIEREGLSAVDIADPVALAAITRALRRAPETQA